jgi:hypothetical protein
VDGLEPPSGRRNPFFDLLLACEVYSLKMRAWAQFANERFARGTIDVAEENLRSLGV